MPARLARMLLAVVLFAALDARALDGVVVDATTGRPVAGATVVAGERVAHGDAEGRFRIDESGAPAVSARAPGYRRAAVALQGAPGAPLTLPLQPLRPKALYLSAWGIGSAALREPALRLVDDTELNALVVDVKGDAGVVPFASDAVVAARGAQTTITVHDMPSLVASLHARGLYLIARVVVFKDDRLVAAHPEWAVRDAAGAIWKDHEGLAWIDPFRADAWQLSLEVAEEAARLGFDELQFDYVRFPDAPGLRYALPNTREARVAAIGRFLDAARRRLARYNVVVAADIFGYVCWNTDDTDIGQQLESLASHVDVLSPMLYPSGFSFGIPGWHDPVAAPREIVQRSLERALARTGLSPLRFRPWLQAFRDYAFDRRPFDADEIRAQIDAAEAVGSDGWMLWNAANHYDAAGLHGAAPQPLPPPQPQPQP